MNLEFGGKSPDVSRVIYTHGSFDGWTKVAAEETFGPSAIVEMIEGAEFSFLSFKQPGLKFECFIFFRCGTRSRLDLL
jgi:hypothetical protein